MDSILASTKLRLALLLLAVSSSLAALRFWSKKGAVAAGVLGIGYYAYAPLLVVVVVSLAGFAWVAGGKRQGIARQAAVALAVMSTWWIVLFLHHWKPDHWLGLGGGTRRLRGVCRIGRILRV